MEQVAPVGPMYQAGTLSGNPLAMAAGIANLTYMRGHNVCSQLESMTAILTGGLAKAAAKAGVPVQVHRLGSMFTVFFTDQEVYDYDSACISDLDAFRIYFHSMLEQGIYLDGEDIVYKPEISYPWPIRLKISKKHCRQLK